MSDNCHLGSAFDDFLEQEGILNEVTEVALKRVLAYGSLIFREGNQIVKEGENKFQEESLVTVRFFAEEEKDRSNGHRVRFHSQ